MRNLLHWLAEFGRTVWRSLFDVGFYREVRSRKLGEAAGHLAVLVSLFWLAPFMVAFFAGSRIVLKTLDSAAKRLPADAAFELKDGRLGNNLAAPLVFRAAGAAFIVNTATSTVGLAAGEEGVVLNPDGLVQWAGSKEASQSAAWPRGQSFRVTRSQLVSGLHSAAPLAVLALAVLALIFAALSAAVALTLMILVHAALVWTALKLLRRPLAFREAAAIAAYAAAIPILLRVLLSWGGAGTLALAFYWTMLGFVVYDIRKGEMPIETPNRPPVVR